MSTSNLKFKSLQEVEDFAIKNNKVVVVNGDTVLDVTTFAKHHPGGPNLLINKQNKDVSEDLKGHRILSYKMANSMAIGSFKTEIRKLIDPAKPLMPQIWNMKHTTYLEAVDSPAWLFEESPKMFESDYLEIFTHNKWYHILIVFFFFTSWILSKVEWNNVTPGSTAIVIIMGIFGFSFAEYVLHRFLFHSEKHLLDNRIMRYVHYCLHGIHHMLPVDPDRLVFPPALAAIFIYTGYQTVYMLAFPFNRDLRIIFWTGFMYGYVIYDMTHYALHHLGKTGSKYFQDLQRYHNKHHFSGEEAGYGVSSKLWDIVFRTELSADEKKSD